MEIDHKAFPDGEKPECPGCGQKAEVFRLDGNEYLYCRTCEPNSPITLKARVAELEVQMENAIELLLDYNEGQLSRDDVLELIATPTNSQ